MLFETDKKDHQKDKKLKSKIRMDKKLSIILGWATFLIAFICYFLSLEPTISFWDCSEFITCAAKLEVGHAPGAPLFMLLGRFFSLFAGSDSSKIPFMINMLSALASAFTIMFLFWTIEWFGKKLSNKLESANNHIYILLASFIGALSFAFTDTFWFSAVEGEVYATSSFFNAIVFWAMLKWESQSDKPRADRWILLIFFLMGLSIGVHLLNLLAIPAIVMVYYYKKYVPSKKGAIKAFLFSALILLFIVFLFIPQIVKIAAYTDLLFVNRFKLPFYSGALFFIFAIIAIIIYLIRYSIKHKKQLLNTIVVSIAVLFIGYSSYTALVIRSLSNTYIDITNVENIFGLLDYLNREQYGKRPLVYGNNFNSPVVESIERSNYKPYKDKYIKKELNPEYVFDKNTLTLFPRMASSFSEAHKSQYKSWVNIKGKPVKVVGNNGKEKIIQVPTFVDNLKFFFKYQLGHMYFRYFMWNFSGRQNNIQGTGEVMHGNWISGIPFIDEIRLGNQDNIPERFANNPARNKYYMLPLIFGLIGLFFQYKKDRQNFNVSFLYFFLTGIAIVFYVNEVPITPRERDYVYVGSFYAFAIWIGLSVIAIIDSLKQKNKYVNYAIASAMFLVLPINLISQNWDDHDRSGRYTARDYAFNLLNSCEKNAILFTSADNDSYPLWYSQEVESYRRDIRAVLTEFLPVDWYINQLRNEYPQMGKLPISFPESSFLDNQRSYLPIIPRTNARVKLDDLIDFVRSDNDKTKYTTYNNQKIDYLPTNKIKVEIDKDNFKKSCKSFKYDEKILPNEIYFDIPLRQLYRDNLIILDIIANNKWERPIYFLNPQKAKDIGLGKFLYREGLAYRLLPFNRDSLQANEIPNNSSYQYNKFMNEFNWGRVEQDDVKLDWTNVRMIGSFQIRDQFNNAAQKLMSVGKKKEAIEILDKCIATFPEKKVPYQYQIPRIIKSYYLAGEKEKASKLFDSLKKTVTSELEYYRNFDLRFYPSLTSNIQLQLYILQLLDQIKFIKGDGYTETINDLNKYYMSFRQVLQ